MNGPEVIRETAERILAQEPDPVVRCRLLRDVLQRPARDPDYLVARAGLVRSRWVQELLSEQWPDGSWGRLHSKDYQAEQRIGTTEVGVVRALSLGLDADHPVLSRAADYLAGILCGHTRCRDRAEKNDRWETGVRLFAASTLAQIMPELTTIDETWHLWVEIASRIFASGDYDPEAEIQAHQELTGSSVANSYLLINNKYALTLLGARVDKLPGLLEITLLRWLWQNDEGIGYLGVPLAAPPCSLKPGPLDRWFASMELLSSFPGWRPLAREAIRWLWDSRRPDGMWDFGRRSTTSVVLPLSESWRRKDARVKDWTARVLALLSRYY